VDLWLKKEGDEFRQGERICQVSLDGLTIGVDGPDKGYIAKILVQPNKIVSVDSVLAQYTSTKEEFMSIRESMRLADEDAELQAEVAEVMTEANKKPDNKVLLRELKRLIQNGHIKEGSSKFPR
jgi:pyruvate/2-oxoglutarate dehydrogenase complex dihydrolipoamide acyltransferase (E2) component